MDDHIAPGDHALGVELQLIELIERQRRALEDGRWAHVAMLQGEIQALQEELGDTTESEWSLPSFTGRAERAEEAPLPPVQIEEASVRLHAHTGSVPVARHFADQTLGNAGRPEMAETVALVVSELVTNAIVHARSDVFLRLVPLHGRVRIEVQDASRQIPLRRDPTPDAESGRGLLLVDTLADHWGTETAGDGKTVWAEVPA